MIDHLPGLVIWRDMTAFNSPVKKSGDTPDIFVYGTRRHFDDILHGNQLSDRFIPELTRAMPVGW